MRWVDLAAVVVIVLVSALVVGLGIGALAVVLTRRSLMRRRPRIAELLWTDSSIVGVVPASTPPLTGRQLAEQSLVGFVLPGPVELLFVVLRQHRRQRRIIVFTADGAMSVLSTGRGSMKPVAVLAVGNRSDWVPGRAGWLRTAFIMGEEMTIPRLGYADQLPT